MGLKYKFKVLDALKAAGWNRTRLRSENADARARGEKACGLSEATIQALREDRPISWASIDTICKKLDCQPGDLLEYIPTDKKGGANK